MSVTIDVSNPERYSPVGGSSMGSLKTWIVPVAAAVGTVAGGKLWRGWTGVIVGALAGVAAGLLAGWALDRPAAGLTAPNAGERVEP